MFELKDTTNEDVKRLIITTDSDNYNTVGFKVNKKELYELFVLLREIFNEEI